MAIDQLKVIVSRAFQLEAQSLQEIIQQQLHRRKERFEVDLDWTHLQYS